MYFFFKLKYFMKCNYTIIIIPIIIIIIFYILIYLSFYYCNESESKVWSGSSHGHLLIPVFCCVFVAGGVLWGDDHTAGRIRHADRLPAEQLQRTTAAVHGTSVLILHRHRGSSCTQYANLTHTLYNIMIREAREVKPPPLTMDTHALRFLKPCSECVLLGNPTLALFQENKCTNSVSNRADWEAVL